jgi:hypothetical protein
MGPTPQKRERLLVAALCAAAAIRVLVLAAAFPLFDNVDETSHFDLVYRYSRGDIPRGLAPKSAEAVRIIRYSKTWEYVDTPQSFPGGRTPPPGWAVPRAVLDGALAEAVVEDAAFTNSEDTQQPLYYFLAGAWYRLGELLGQRQGLGVYWIRFLNAPLVALMVWLVYLVAGALLPGAATVRLGATVLAAFFPQDAFLSIGNDVLAPVMVGLAFLALVKLVDGEPKGIAPHVLAGLAVSASVLAKLTNVPILGVAAAVAAGELLDARRSGKLSAAWPRVVALAAAIALPAGLWAARNYSILGNLTGMAQKAARLDWTPKPLGELFPHPIFTPSGLWHFLHGLIASFWRGEFYWHGERLAWAWADGFYVLSSLLLLSVAAFAVLRRRRESVPHERFGLRAGLLLLLLSVLLLAWGSMAYDFGRCRYPSRELPFITSGRLMGGALAPFLCLYVLGLDRLLSRFGAGRAVLPVVALVAAAITVVELVLALGAFASRFNWFHMLAA